MGPRKSRSGVVLLPTCPVSPAAPALKHPPARPEWSGRAEDGEAVGTRPSTSYRGLQASEAQKVPVRAGHGPCFRLSSGVSGWRRLGELGGLG